MNLFNLLVGLVALVRAIEVTAQEQIEVEGSLSRQLFASCPPEDVCGSGPFGFFKKYQLREVPGCNSICTWKVFKYLRRGFICVSEAEGLCKGRFLFEEGQLEGVAAPSCAYAAGDVSTQHVRRATEVAEDLNGNIEGTFLAKENCFVDAEKISTLQEYIDKALEEALAEGNTELGGVSIEQDFLFDVSAATLKKLIGMENVIAIYKFYQEYGKGFPVSRISMRRINYDEEEMHLAWHVDGEANMVTHVFLNEVEGGNYMFLGPEGTEEVEAKTGSCLVHGENVVHGIASFVGARYTFLFVGDNSDATDIILELLKEEGITMDLADE